MRKNLWKNLLPMMTWWVLIVGVLCCGPVSSARAAFPADGNVSPATSSNALEQASPSRTITFLYTNDHHSHLLPSDIPEFGKDLGGIDRREAMIRAIRASQPATLLLDGGDIFQGSPFYSVFHGEADLAAYGLCGYDATVLGNHDLDDGLENTLKQYARAKFPLLCANVCRKGQTGTVFPPYRIFERGGWKIGVVGVIGMEAFDVISIGKRANLEVRDPFQTAASYARFLWNDVDFLVLLSHMGYGNDLEFAGKNADYDLIIGGHTNTVLDAPVFVKSKPFMVRNRSENGIGGTLVVQAFKWGVFLGRLDFTMRTDGRIESWSGGLQPVNASVTVDPKAPIVKLVNAYHDRIKAQTGQVIGFCREPLNYPEDEKHHRDLPMGRFACEAMREFAGADLAILNAGGIRDRLASGPVRVGDLITVFPFENFLVTMTMKGSAIQRMFDFISRRFGATTGYQYGGVTGVLDVGAGVARELAIRGKSLDPDRDYCLVTISYLTEGNQNGGDLFKEARDVKQLPVLMREAAIDFFRRHRELTPPKGDQIRIVGVSPGR